MITDQLIDLKCPACKKKLRDADRMESATLCVKRTCRCGVRWSVILRPVRTTKDDKGNLVIAMHILEWTRLGVGS